MCIAYGVPSTTEHLQGDIVCVRVNLHHAPTYLAMQGLRRYSDNSSAAFPSYCLLTEPMTLETLTLYGERKGINNWNGTGQTLATLFLSVALLAPYPAAWIGQTLLSRFEGWFRSDKKLSLQYSRPYQ